MTIFDTIYGFKETAACVGATSVGFLADKIVGVYDVSQVASVVAKEEFTKTIIGVQTTAAAAHEYVSGGIGAAGSAMTGVVGTLGETVSAPFKTAKLWLWIPLILIVFVVVMVSIGYSGLGGPVARVAEREHARRR